jgi:hypothetical protein
MPDKTGLNLYAIEEVPVYKNSNIPESILGDDAPEFKTEEDEIELGILQRDFTVNSKTPAQD